MTKFPASKQIQILKSGIQTLCRSFWGPDPESCQEMLTSSLMVPLRIYGASLSGEIAKQIETLSNSLRSYKSVETLNEELQTDYVRLFINDREGIRTPLYHSCYDGNQQNGKAPLMGNPEREMRERFAEVGLAIGNSINEPADHISLELEYLYFLLDQGLQLEDPDLISEAALFSQDFISPWIKEMSVRFEDVERATFYPQLVNILIYLLEDIARL